MNKSLFVLNTHKENKNEETKIFSEFQNCIKNIAGIYNIDYKEKNILKLNIKESYLISNKLNSFIDYINYISFIGEKKEIINLLINNLNNDFNLSIELKKFDKNVKLTENEERIKINKDIKDYQVKGNLNKINYKNFKSIFENNRIRLSDKTKSSVQLIEIIKNNIKFHLDKYLDLTIILQFKERLFNYLKKEINKNYYEIIQTYEIFKKIYRSIIVKNPNEFLNQIEKEFNELSSLQAIIKNGPLQLIIDEYEKLKRFSKHKFISNFLLIGEYSS